MDKNTYPHEDGNNSEIIERLQPIQLYEVGYYSLPPSRNTYVEDVEDLVFHMPSTKPMGCDDFSMIEGPATIWSRPQIGPENQD